MPRIYLSPPELVGTEIALASDAIASGWLAPLGAHVDAFEAEVAHRLAVPHALALSSGTAALHLALAAIGVGAGDEVWTSTLTFAATANAIAYTGATPVFIDSDLTTWNMDAQLLSDALRRAASAGTLPKAVIVVDLYGQCADLDPIVAACREHGVVVIEDAAEALGATYRGRAAGSVGDLAILSFNGNKIITTSGGGMLVGHRKEWIDRARHLATQAREPARHYEHREVGYNYRLSNVLAAIGRAQLRDLERRVAARRSINTQYRQQLGDLPGWTFMPEASFGQCTFWLSCATIDAQSPVTRDAIIDHLAELGIEARPVWKPMHLQPAFRDRRVIGGTVAARLFETGLCLPSGSQMRSGDVGEVGEAIRQLASRASS